MKIISKTYLTNKNDGRFLYKFAYTVLTKAPVSCGKMASIQAKPSCKDCKNYINLITIFLLNERPEIK
jgi:hypothetical protein